ncbi:MULTISPECIES: hypothetical protein [Cysteiniphilum]|uniref:hypothetical protein n=1 Tax=Cysteiniphilum TaxID=2056696 RepID=UPI0017851729|nr:MULTISPECIES: hypothetical protein [Cysteiniphilum]
MWIALFSALFGALFGGIIALITNIILYKKQQKNCEHVSISNNIAMINAILTRVFELKKYLIKLKNDLNNEHQRSDPTRNVIQFETLIPPISIVELKLMTLKYPNIILLLNRLNSSITKFNISLNEYNNAIKGANKLENNVWHYKWVMFYQCLLDSTNNVIYFSILAQKQLAIYGARTYGKKFILKENKYTDQGDLIPPPKPCWEEIVYFPKSDACIRAFQFQYGAYKVECAISKESI